MAQTLGPLTAVLAAYKSRDPYRNKWIETVKRDLVYIRNAINLCNAMQEKRAEEIAPALSAFADVILIAGTRNAQRAFFPLCFIIYCLGTADQLKKCEITRAHTPMDPTQVDFSGKGMWLVYQP
ncbi:unnamed protein product [Parnassius apollo]|nr:unnamed protein product [Parnassius apollo]